MHAALCYWMLCSASAMSLPATAAAPDRVLSYKRVGKTELMLHVFLPPGWQPSDQRPALLLFFGGGWTTGAASQFYPQCRHLADRGMVAISADYRIRDKHGTSPAVCVQDGKSAVRWVRQHAGELGIHPQQVVVGGASAGGQVAAATALAHGFNEAGEDRKISSRPDALVLFNPVIDNGPEGYGHDRVKDYWRDFSPLHNLVGNPPPTIFFLGTQDKLIPVATAQRYQQRMERAGQRCELHLYQGASHGFFNRAEYMADTLKKTEAFLISLGFLTPAPSRQASDSLPQAK